MAKQYAVCSSCAVVISNNDTSHIEESELDRITEAVDSIELVVHVETEHNDGYWNCDICDNIYCGDDSEIYESIH